MTTTAATVAQEPPAVVLNGVTYPAEPVARGAAFEIFSTSRVDGFVRNPGPARCYPSGDSCTRPMSTWLPAISPRLVGVFRDAEYEAIADPPDEFWLLAKVRALRHPMTSPSRRTPLVSWRGETCPVVRHGGDWLRVRMMRPNPEALTRLGATCVERGVYEAWAPTAEVDGHGDLVVRYRQPIA